MNNAVMIAMSAGVDSAIAAHLIASSNVPCAGVTMQHFEGCGAHDATEAAALCAKMGIPHFTAELSDAFYKEVILPFIKAYEDGATPNPCVLCNKHVKFGALLEYAGANGYDRIATGHYARLERSASGRMLLRRAVDEAKDQTYMLYTLTQDVLARVCFPLGEMKKQEVRALAASLGLSVANREDSQDICFIPDGDYAAYIARTTGKTYKRGTFLSMDGSVIGEHRGQLHYTIGQRKGLGIALGAPAYVVSKSAKDNTVTLGKNEDLFTSRLTANHINLIPFDSLDTPIHCLAKVRYAQAPTRVRVEQIDKDELLVEFETPQRAISRGQSLVLYEDDYLVGGGTIL